VAGTQWVHRCADTRRRASQTGALCGTQGERASVGSRRRDCRNRWRCIDRLAYEGERLMGFLGAVRNAFTGAPRPVAVASLRPEGLTLELSTDALGVMTRHVNGAKQSVTGEL